MNIFIDTQLWVYAFKKPRKDAFTDRSEYDKAHQMHIKANKFIRDALLNHTIYITTHQLAEIFHALAFRGIKVSRSEALKVIEKLLRSSKTVIVDVKRKHYKEALKLSSLSGIHVWDYLCILPLKEIIDIDYTNDQHFLHPTTKSLVPKIDNPLGEWIPI